VASTLNQGCEYQSVIAKGIGSGTIADCASPPANAVRADGRWAASEERSAHSTHIDATTPVTDGRTAS
jgi:hypothetical protein